MLTVIPLSNKRAGHPVKHSRAGPLWTRYSRKMVARPMKILVNC